MRKARAEAVVQAVCERVEQLRMKTGLSYGEAACLFFGENPDVYEQYHSAVMAGGGGTEEEETVKLEEDPRLEPARIFDKLTRGIMAEENLPYSKAILLAAEKYPEDYKMARGCSL